MFWEATDRLEHLSFAVLALGDSSCEFFRGLQNGARRYVRDMY